MTTFKINNNGQPNKKARSAIDTGMDTLLAQQLPGQCYSLQQIAEACGCRHSYISQLYRSALSKVAQLAPRFHLIDYME